MHTNVEDLPIIKWKDKIKVIDLLQIIKSTPATIPFVLVRAISSNIIPQITVSV